MQGIGRRFRRGDAPSPRGFLARLARNTAGNAMVIMTAALIPLAGMVGGGIDMSRMYILKTRLQHACDAGALAGRKAMGGGNWSFNSQHARGQAEKFFDANFEPGSFGSSGLTRSFSEQAGKVTGTAQATIPMTLMRVFGRTTENIAVTCDADMRLPNTDVMFVLDTTGSMNDPQPGDNVNKISALKTAVKCFYEIVAKIDTNATCTTGVPSGGTSDQVQIRFGFVPYSTNVNVGRLLPTSWFADSATYQTRQALMTAATWQQRGQPRTDDTAMYASNVSNADCNNTNISRYNQSSESVNAAGTEKTAYSETYTRTGWSNNNCYVNRHRSWTTYDRGPDAFNGWRYAPLPVNVGLLKNGTGWNTSFQWPIGANGTNATITWRGCIEERDTVRQTSYQPIPAGAKDLDIDLVPDSDATRWKPAIPDAVYARGAFSGTNTAAYSYDPVERSATDSDYARTSSAFCPQEGRKLKAYGIGSDFDSYVDSLYPEGNTYHDIGLIWGARLMSPTGLFASENALTDRGGEIERHMIFMTDGDACAQAYDYTAYGFNWFDRRQTPVANAPTGGCTTNDRTLVEQVNKRTEGLCTAIKNKNITLWVVAFGTLATETTTRLTNCATPGKYFTATNAAELQQTFKNIADQISQLRLTR